MSDKKNFEEALKDFEETLKQLEATNITIDEAIKLHENAMKKYEICEDILKETEQKIEVYKKEQEKQYV